MSNTSMNEQPHRRLNILTGEWILVSPHRTKRPWQGKMETVQNDQLPSYDENCYLCPGNTRAGGVKNDEYTKPHAFVNDFSALLSDIPNEHYKEGLLEGKSEAGICKVMCFSPDHSKTLPVMSTNEITDVISLWQQEYQDLGARKEINHVMIFENKGANMGCSNPHPHGQIWAQETVPGEVEKKTIRQKSYFDANRASLLGEYLAQELNAAKRVIFENEHFAAIVPYWAVWPYETMIVPKRQLRHIGELSTNEKESFAEAIKVVTTKYDNLFKTSFPYSAGIHQSPTDGEAHDEWHFHMAFYPPLLRSATVKKFMVGYEMFANPQRDITAEQAAATLKELSEVHYTQEADLVGES